MKSAAILDGEIKTLDLHDLVRLSHMPVHLNRIMSAQRNRGEQLSGQASLAASQLTSEPESKNLFERVNHTIRTALLAPGIGSRYQAQALLSRWRLPLNKSTGTAVLRRQQKSGRAQLKPGTAHLEPG